MLENKILFEMKRITKAVESIAKNFKQILEVVLKTFNATET